MTGGMVNIAVFVSGGGTNLQALIDAERRGSLAHGRLSLVMSSRDGVLALDRAHAAGIETAVVGSVQYPDRAERERVMLDILSSRGIDMIVLAGYLSILSSDFTERYPRRIINVHPSLIPSFCGEGFYGLRVHEEALRRGVRVTGATVHFVNEIPDGGEIIMQRAVSVRPGDTPEILQQRVMKQAEWRLLPAATELVAREIAAGRG